jgi:hypothetical protein
VISDADAALRELLLAEVLRDQPAEVVFDAPTTDWAARRTGPAVNVFLYDIREEPERRDPYRVPVRGPSGRVGAHRPGPRFYRLSYLVTAWTARPQDEHHLLGQLLENLVRFDVIPPEHLHGRLADHHVTLQVALPPGEDRSLTDLWTALGGEMKPSLDVVLVAPLHPAKEFAAGPPVQERVVDVTRR